MTPRTRAQSSSGIPRRSSHLPAIVSAGSVTDGAPALANFSATPFLAALPATDAETGAIAVPATVLLAPQNTHFDDVASRTHSRGHSFAHRPASGNASSYSSSPRCPIIIHNNFELPASLAQSIEANHAVLSRVDRQQDRISSRHTITPVPWRGESDKLHLFIDDCRVAFGLDDARFANRDRSKVMFALGHMQQGTAGEWRNLRLQELANNSWCMLTWEEFEAQLWQDFGNINRQAQAQHDLDKFYQRSLPAGEYLIKFDRLRILAGFHKDSSLIALLRRLLCHDLLAKVLRAGPANTYSAWKTQAIASDQVLTEIALTDQAPARYVPPFHRIPALRPNPATLTPAHAAPIAGHTAAPAAPSPLPTTTSAATPQTHVMACSRCYNCLQMGHFTRDCMAPKTHIKAMLDKLDTDDPKEQEEFVRNIGGAFDWVASGFATVDE